MIIKSVLYVANKIQGGKKMKTIYDSPSVILITLKETDIVRTSPGDKYEGDDFPAFAE